MPLPQPTDKSDTNTLPDPELNPLLNPLLAENLGRWAQVYFTSAPEKREEAVSELLRELRNGSPSASASVPVIQRDECEKKPEIEEVHHSSSAAAASLQVCAACGHNNLAAQKFCGMCGAPLQISAESNPSQAADDVTISAARWRDSESAPGGEQAEHAMDSSVRPVDAGGGEGALESPWTLPGGSLPSFAVESESEPVSNRYRLYVGMVLACLIALLLYAAWPGPKANSGSATQSAVSGAIPPAPPAEPAASPQPSAIGTEGSEENSPASPLPIEKQPTANSRKSRPVAARPAPRIATMASGSTTPADGSGAEELTTAEKYLSGAQGVSRDSREAAQWLWKAVGKGNVAATVALSDLYLHGDGVPKSCDQARLLLDAAARKGGTAAAARLRNLQAFGCN
jgi:hypothetical protein